MSTTDTPTDQNREPNAEDIYERHDKEIDEFADREDIVGAVARAVQRLGGDEEDV